MRHQNTYSHATFGPSETNRPLLSSLDRSVAGLRSRSSRSRSGVPDSTELTGGGAAADDEMLESREVFLARSSPDNPRKP